MKVVAVVVFLTTVGSIFGNQVLDLTDDDFASRIADIDATLVLFHDAWCTYCGDVVKEFDEAAKLLELSGVNQPFRLARVDCNEGGKQICLENSIELDQYAKMKIFRMGRMGQDYSGPEDAAGIIKFMKGRYGIASLELSNVADVEKLLKVDEPTIFGFFEKGSDIETFFLQYAEEFKEEFRFAHSSESDVLTKYNQKNSIVFFRAPRFQNKFEPNSITFDGIPSREGLTNFINKNRHGLVGHRVTDNVRDFDYPNVIVYYEVDYVNNVKKTNYWRNRILQIAKDNPDYKFAISDGNEFRLELETFGKSYLGEKPLVTAHDETGRRFKMSTEFSVENLKQFVADVKGGRMEPFKKSLPVPSSNDGPVKIAVAKNFDEVVFNNGKDTFIEIYAPWCGFCKELAPVFDELGEKMADENVEIVKFDGTNNEVPTIFALQGYPSLFWMPRDSKTKPIAYTDGNNLENFIKFIAKHATEELKNYDRNGEIKKSEL